jgi:hypothetical protein
MTFIRFKKRMKQRRAEMKKAIKWSILIIGALFGAVAWNSNEKDEQ